MQNVYDFFNYIILKKSYLLDLTLKHIQLTMLAVLIAIAVGVPLGILIAKVKKLSSPILGVANVMQAIPSLALLGFLIPLLGIGEKPAIVMVLLYSLLPIIKNTYTGLTNINPAMIEAGRAMGMTETQLLRMVQLPLAFPVIMAGIRISAVTAVGLMTIAAFIGAGGLGETIFIGIQTVNNNMIVSGAIPACILALLMDFIIGKIESNASKRKNKSKNKNLKKILIPTIAIILAGIILVPMLFKGKGDTITIGSKNFSEQNILGSMYQQLVEEHTDLKVNPKFNLGGTDVIFSAIRGGDVDMYVDYTGTGLVNILKKPVINDPDKAYKFVKDAYKSEFNLAVLDPLGFNNTYAIAMKPDVAKKYNIETLSDLAKSSSNLVAGVTLEFLGRPDGIKGMANFYNMKFKEEKGVDSGLRYTSIESNTSQVTDAFSTDGLLKAFNLKVLKDDKQFFPPYYAVPIVRQEVLDEHPELEEVFNMLKGKLNDETMRELNYKVDKLGQPAADVAKEFLKSQNLIK